jgi:hypothetical protein
MLKGKKILIGITGSIAAYKIPLLVRLFIKAGAEVKVVMTGSACDFVTPLTLSTLSQQPILIEPYNKVDGSWHSHVDWGRWADVFILAPVSANVRCFLHQPWIWICSIIPLPKKTSILYFLTEITSSSLKPANWPAGFVVKAAWRSPK